MKTKKYKLSFTAVSFMLNNTIKVAEKYNELRDWSTVETEIIENNLLQKRTLSTAKRMFKEYKCRVQALNTEELELLLSGSFEVQKQINLLAICKTYQVILDFIIDIVRNKYLEFNAVLKDIDFEIFLDDKSLDFPELEKLKDSTKVKLRRVVFRILDESGLITDIKSKLITPILIKDEVKNIVAKNNPELLKIYLLADIEINNAYKHLNGAINEN